ncbi:hypothetical protein [Prochlorococcus sp. MIT 1307]|uniref:hypothetical protein n=1 Tax=Prochlorococcus sp. MIT 1307 TaxID=3096219 RepID=UPI002A74D4E5|nr:hypothetical protein [Prochlorococcus sp. MIT 1307]
MPIRVNRARKYLSRYNKSENIIEWVKTEEIAKDMNHQFKQSIRNENNISFRNLSELKKIIFKQYNIGFGVASTLITYSANPDPFPLSLEYEKECYQQIISSIKSIIFAEILLASNQYEAVVLFNGRMSCEQAFRQVATSKNVKVYFHERFNFNTRYFFEEYTPHDFPRRKEEMERIKLELPKSIINRLGEDFFKRKVKGDGVYERSYTKWQLKGSSKSLEAIIKEKKKDNIKIVSYFTSSDDEYQSIYGFPERYPEWQDQKSAIKKISKIVNSLGYYFIVRVHPNLKNKHPMEQKRWQDLGDYIVEKGGYWIGHKDPESTYKLISDSSIVVSAGSTVGIESIYLGKPSVVITKCFYDTLVSSARLCESESAFRSLLSDDNFIKQIPDKSDAYIYGAWIMAYGHEYNYFVPTHEFSCLYGLMKDGTRIASPANSQRIIEIIKFLIGKRGAFHLTL